MTHVKRRQAEDGAAGSVTVRIAPRKPASSTPGTDEHRAHDYDEPQAEKEKLTKKD